MGNGAGRVGPRGPQGATNTVIATTNITLPRSRPARS